MSQQSVTFLSQAANQLHNPPKPVGGRERFHINDPFNPETAAAFIPAGKGNMLLHRSLNHERDIRQEVCDAEEDYALNRPMNLKEYHYQTMQKGKDEMYLEKPINV